MTSVAVIVRGRVQGVGYRWFVRDLATARGVSGWVRNRRDGTVESQLHGDAEQVDAVLRAMREGPHHSQVDALETTPVPNVAVDGFEIRPTA